MSHPVLTVQMERYTKLDDYLGKEVLQYATKEHLLARREDML